jgi:hypothetical protein
VASPSDPADLLRATDVFVQNRRKREELSQMRKIEDYSVIAATGKLMGYAAGAASNLEPTS